MLIEVGSGICLRWWHHLLFVVDFELILSQLFIQALLCLYLADDAFLDFRARLLLLELEFQVVAAERQVLCILLSRESCVSLVVAPYTLLATKETGHKTLILLLLVLLVHDLVDLNAFTSTNLVELLIEVGIIYMIVPVVVIADTHSVS